LVHTEIICSSPASGCASWKTNIDLSVHARIEIRLACPCIEIEQRIKSSLSSSCCAFVVVELHKEDIESNFLDDLAQTLVRKFALRSRGKKVLLSWVFGFFHVHKLPKTLGGLGISNLIAWKLDIEIEAIDNDMFRLVSAIQWAWPLPSRVVWPICSPQKFRQESAISSVGQVICRILRPARSFNYLIIPSSPKREQDFFPLLLTKGNTVSDP